MKLVSKPVEVRRMIVSDEDGKLWVLIRQATFAESRELRELTAGMRIVETKKDNTLAMEQDVNQNDIKAKSIFLTLSGIGGIEDDDGNPIEPIAFRTSAGVSKVANESVFMTVLGKFSDEVVDEIYDVVLEVNPQWDNRKKRGE